MSTHDESSLLSALQSHGLVAAPSAAAMPAQSPVLHRPWYIGLILGASGWLAGLFVLGFVALLFRPDTAPALAVCGAVLLAAAWGLFVVDRDGAFTSQLALALSIAGQCLMLFAMTRDTHSVVYIAGAACLLQVLMVLLMPNRLHRSMCTLFALIAWAVWIRAALWDDAAWGLAGAPTPTPAPTLAAALTAWVLAWGPVAAVLGWLLRAEHRWVAGGWAPVLRPVLAGLLLGLAGATLASYPFESLRWWGDGAMRPNGLALWPLLSAAMALLALAAAFALRSRALMGTCVVAALLHITHFYYVLGASLMLKSLLMLAMGAVLLLAAAAVAKRQGAT